MVQTNLDFLGYLSPVESAVKRVLIIVPFKPIYIASKR